MMSKEVDKNREQIQFFAIDDLVPKDHMLRLIDKAIDWDTDSATVQNHFPE